MKNTVSMLSALMTAGFALLGSHALAMGAKPAADGSGCAQGKAGLTLPDGFCATVFADTGAQARHMATTADGTLYVNNWISPFKPGAGRDAGGFILALRDADGDGSAELKERFGEDSANEANTGGTGLALYGGYIYAEETGKIVRYPLADGQMKPKGPGQIVLEGLVLTEGHTMHSIAIGDDGSLYVNSGSATNSCQVQERALESPGQKPCKELATRAGVWKYDATKLGQKFGPAERFVSNLRNAVALDFDADGDLYAVPHGRDQLYENWPKKFNEQQGSELPAEMMVKLVEGAGYGWPQCYYDGIQNKYVLAPEYGGDGKKVGECADKPAPAAVFPAHWAPNALLFYTSDAFGEHYKNGAFIAFHGSWNRKVQQGYNVVFQPFDASGNASGAFEVFADGFAGANKSPPGAAHRPTGLAMGPDGALYVSDDQAGRIYRIVKK